jgi:hypothetical protein
MLFCHFCRFTVSIRNLEVTAMRLVVLWLVVQGGATLLHLAASAGHVGLMHALLTAGADARSLDEVLNTHLCVFVLRACLRT